VPDDVATFFERLRLSPRSYNNFLRSLRTFFAFAQNHGWLSKEAELLARVATRAREGEIVEKGKFHGRFLRSEYFALQKCATQRNAACNIHAGCSEPRRCNSVRGDRMRAASKRNSFFREPAAVGAGDTPKLTAWLLIAGFQRFQLSVFRRFLRAINR